MPINDNQSRSELSIERKELTPKHLEDLENSGLSHKTIEEAGIYSATAHEVWDILGVNPSNSPGMVFPYFTSTNGDGKPCVRVKPDHPPVIDGKPAKYLSPKGSMNHLYIPQGLTSVLKDASAPIYITEGEKKALKACQEGLPCIGLSGVWCWKSKGEDQASHPIPDLDLIVWKNRKVFIVFDSDLVQKPSVMKAEKALAEELSGRGTIVRTISLPGDKGNKVGLDDFLINNPVVNLLQLPQGIPTAKGKHRDSQGAILLDLIESQKLFYDQNKCTYVFINCEVIPIASKKFRHWLVRQYHVASGKIPNADALNQTLAALESKALYEGDYHQLFNRIAHFEEAFWYDLGNGSAIKTCPNSWDIIDAPILFRRYSHQQQQVVPLRGGGPYEIFDFINVAESQRLLFMVWLISNFIPDIPHPIFHPHGPQGAGKTFLCKLVKRICDPSSIDALITPKDRNELIQIINHNHICLLDNMSDLPQWMSDILAQASTGGGFSKRQLYTDDDDIIYNVKRCIGINGINLLISKPDLMDRSILLYLERIEPSSRMEESELIKKFEEKRAGIIGGIFDALCKAMAIYPTVHLKMLPRMADFARWGYAIAEALGLEGEDFIKAYDCNIRQQNEEVIQFNTLAQAFINFMADKQEWNGTIKEAYEGLYAIANPDKNDPTFPKSNRTLKKLLERIRPNLAEHGIKFRYGPRTVKGYTVSFHKAPELDSFDSESSKLSPQNEFRNEPRTNDDANNQFDSAFLSEAKYMPVNDFEDAEPNEAKSGTV